MEWRGSKRDKELARSQSVPNLIPVHSTRLLYLGPDQHDPVAEAGRHLVHHVGEPAPLARLGGPQLA
jgi:hypothetical protein